MIPPSPPVFAYEVETFSTAVGGSALLCLLGCLCCTVFGAKSERGRHTSRFWGTKLLRVDRMPYAEQEHRLRGEHWEGPFRGDVPMRARDMVRADTSLTFASLLGGHAEPSARSLPADRRRGWTPVERR